MLGSLCECGDLLTCTAVHTHKSGKSPPPAAATVAVAMTAVAVVAVAGRGGWWRENDAAQSMIVLTCGCRC